MRIYARYEPIYGETTFLYSITFRDRTGNVICINAEEIDYHHQQDGRIIARMKKIFSHDKNLENIHDILQMAFIGINVIDSAENTSDSKMIQAEIEFSD